MPQQSNGTGRFIGQTCQLDKTFGSDLSANRSKMVKYLQGINQVVHNAGILLWSSHNHLWMNCRSFTFSMQQENRDKMYQITITAFNPSAAGFFCYPLAGHAVNFLQTCTWHGPSFSILIVWHQLFSLLLMFSRVRIDASPPSTVQGKCIYTFLKWRTSRFNFRS